MQLTYCTVHQLTGRVLSTSAMNISNAELYLSVILNLNKLFLTNPDLQDKITTVSEQVTSSLIIPNHYMAVS